MRITSKLTIYTSHGPAFKSTDNGVTYLFVPLSVAGALCAIKYVWRALRGECLI